MNDKANDNVVRFKANGPYGGLMAIGERWSRGDIPVCPHCGADLLVAFNWEDANKLNVHPGISCPNDPRHFEVWVNVEKRK